MYRCGKNISFLVEKGKKDKGDTTFETLFWYFYGRASKWMVAFWNPETKLDKIGMFKKKYCFISTIWLFWPDSESNVKMSVTIEFYVPRPARHMSHVTRAIFSNGHLICPNPENDLRFTWALSSLLIWHVRHPFSGTLAQWQLGLASAWVWSDLKCG